MSCFLIEMTCDLAKLVGGPEIAVALHFVRDFAHNYRAVTVVIFGMHRTSLSRDRYALADDTFHEMSARVTALHA